MMITTKEAQGKVKGAKDIVETRPYQVWSRTHVDCASQSQWQQDTRTHWFCTTQLDMARITDAVNQFSRTGSGTAVPHPAVPHHETWCGTQTRQCQWGIWYQQDTKLVHICMSGATETLNRQCQRGRQCASGHRHHQNKTIPSLLTCIHQFCITEANPGCKTDALKWYHRMRSRTLVLHHVLQNVMQDICWFCIAQPDAGCKTDVVN